jgi:hypothetical protein
LRGLFLLSNLHDERLRRVVSGERLVDVLSRRSSRRRGVASLADAKRCLAKRRYEEFWGRVGGLR